MQPQHAQDDSVPAPRGQVRGGFGDDMDLACTAIYDHFRGLPGWQGRALDDHEVVFLAGFFAFIALASSPGGRFPVSEAATGARASVARSMMLHGTPAEALGPRIKAFQARLNRYTRFWVGVLKGENTFGVFATHAFENVQAGERTRYGYADHLDTFAEFCERRIEAFHRAVPVPVVERGKAVVSAPTRAVAQPTGSSEATPVPSAERATR